jgi:hypothetical protein
MKIGIILLLIGIIGYFFNVFLIKRYHDRRTPGILEMDKRLPDGKYAWEHTAGTRIVPRWVSIIGLFSTGIFILGVILLIISFFM